jgi:hypothetical protein
MQNPPGETPENETPSGPKTKNRHGCLTVWLILLIVGAFIVIFEYVAESDLLQSTGGLPGWSIGAFIVIGIWEIVCAIALFRWKKWGFWGFCIIAVIGVLINIVLGLGVLSFVGLVGIAMLYGVLHIGKENKGWPQLE